MSVVLHLKRDRKIATIHVLHERKTRTKHIYTSAVDLNFQTCSFMLVLALKKEVNQPLKDEHGHGLMESTGRNLFIGIVFQWEQTEFSIGPFEI